MKIKKFVLFFSIIGSVVFLSCEKLAEEDTPICKDCYKVRMYISNNQVKDTLNFYRLCGGDVIAWENFTDSIQDTLKIHCYCNN
jgi:hypothetical protein